MQPVTAPTRRSGGIAGVLAGLTFALGLFLPTLPGGDNGVATALQAYRDTGRQSTALVAAMLLLVTALLVAWFLATLVLASRAAGTPVVFAGLTGAASVASLVVAAASLVGLATPLMQNSGLTPDASTTALGELAVSALVMAALSAGTAVVAVSVAARRTATMPRWATRAGLVIGPLLVLSVTVAPMVLLSVWLVLAGAALARGTDLVPAADGRASAGVRLPA